MSAATPAADISGTVFEEGSSEVARSYSTALLNLTEEQAATEAVLAELDEFKTDVFRDQPQLAHLLTRGIPDASRRDQLLVSLFEKQASTTLFCASCESSIVEGGWS